MRFHTAEATAPRPSGRYMLIVVGRQQRCSKRNRASPHEPPRRRRPELVQGCAVRGLVVAGPPGSLDGMQGVRARPDSAAVSNPSARQPLHAMRSSVSPRMPSSLSCGDALRSRAAEGGVWGPHSLHTAEVVGWNPTTPTSTNALPSPRGWSVARTA
jgi:hypothetical protein